ncbi:MULTISPECIES: hypothetical protein [unclassified Streptomyces]|uniref:hypothetical protein n=1 Tax=unclassified Streptomyces TaxID=2593676 RepID=UPI002E36A08E|nr:hypothetical protein [Streptomyces sp. NBC_01477]
MTPVQILSLLLALSCAANIAVIAGFAGRAAGLGLSASLMAAGTAGASSLGLYFAALAAYR